MAMVLKEEFIPATPEEKQRKEETREKLGQVLIRLATEKTLAGFKLGEQLFYYARFRGDLIELEEACETFGKKKGISEIITRPFLNTGISYYQSEKEAEPKILADEHCRTWANWNWVVKEHLKLGAEPTERRMPEEKKEILDHIINLYPYATKTAKMLCKKMSLETFRYYEGEIEREHRIKFYEKQIEEEPAEKNTEYDMETLQSLVLEKVYQEEVEPIYEYFRVKIPKGLIFEERVISKASVDETDDADLVVSALRTDVENKKKPYGICPHCAKKFKVEEIERVES